ncbi:hypothetical protein SKAU_G00114230 [Synaphobranchus kaupii]|uniref:Uncharacterized protein n=1 Tax=Synaphobranchus kaupii TaxID=118154 RepID=A0A9Q1G1V5_SYNKA|nr:hypothetical protein SKAU_G00114230 [Synaphobranchus kaupii]
MRAPSNPRPGQASADDGTTPPFINRQGQFAKLTRGTALLLHSSTLALRQGAGLQSHPWGPEHRSTRKREQSLY